jgi:uncharacterized protein (TIGR03083 family)
MSIDLGELYAASRHRITDLIMTAPPERIDQQCPSTPDWTVHHLVAHLRGVTEDVRLGNVAAAGTDPWTADQVRRHGNTDIKTLLVEWSDDAPVLESFLSSPHGEAAARALFDVHVHEADLRGALDRVVDLPGVFGDWAIGPMTEHFVSGSTAAGLPPIRIQTDEGDEIGPADADVVLRISRYELFRALLGRRSASQVCSYDWSGVDARPYLTHFFVFGPRTTDLVESPSAPSLMP